MGSHLWVAVLHQRVWKGRRHVGESCWNRETNRDLEGSTFEYYTWDEKSCMSGFFVLFWNLFFCPCLVDKKKKQKKTKEIKAKLKSQKQEFLLLLALSVFDGHLVTVDHVKSSVSVPHRFGLPAAVVVNNPGARGRTGAVVSAAALGIHEERCSSFRDHLACLAPATSFELSKKKKKTNRPKQWQSNNNSKCDLPLLFPT